MIVTNKAAKVYSKSKQKQKEYSKVVRHYKKYLKQHGYVIVPVISVTQSDYQ